VKTDSDALDIRDLTVRYGKSVVLNGLDLSTQAGGISGLIGPNGAGKTTLLDALYALIPVEKGAVHWCGRPLGREDVGYLEAVNYFYPMITGREYLELFRFQNVGFEVEAWSEVFDIPMDRTIDVYSLGMKKKLALLGVLSLDRPILMLDEPFNHLDLESNHLLLALLRKLADSGKTILLTSHILASLTQLCDDIHFLMGGKIGGSFARKEFAAIGAWLESAEYRGKEALVRRLLEE
jgi:ABC-2 type transport system ATP-binding protein